MPVNYGYLTICFWLLSIPFGYIYMQEPIYYIPGHHFPSINMVKVLTQITTRVYKNSLTFTYPSKCQCSTDTTTILILTDIHALSLDVKDALERCPNPLLSPYIFPILWTVLIAAMGTHVSLPVFFLGLPPLQFYTLTTPTAHLLPALRVLYNLKHVGSTVTIPC